MTTQQDAQIGFKKESVFKTPVVVDVFPEFIEEDLAWEPEFVQGAGLRVSKRLALSGRRVLGKESVGGSFTVEAYTKGLGKLIEAALGGTGTSTNIAGASYQQLFTPTTTDYLDSYTIQKGIPPLGGGTTLPHTFNGMVCSGFEFTSPENGIPTLKFNWVGAGVDTSTGLATASYATGVNVFSSKVHGSLTVGGTVTVPTTTALATGGTTTATAASVREFNLTYDNGLDSNGWNFGSTGKRSRKPAVGLRSITGNMVVEFDAATARDLYLNQTDTAITFRLQTTTAISGSNYPTLEFTIPIARFEGEIPNAAAGDVVTLSMDFTALDGLVAAHPFYVAIVTAETAI